jgi:hypothetical protein
VSLKTSFVIRYRSQLYKILTMVQQIWCHSLYGLCPLFLVNSTKTSNQGQENNNVSMKRYFFGQDGHSYYQPLGLSSKRGVFVPQKNVQSPHDNGRSLSFNPLNTKRRLLYLKTHSVPRCKHFLSRL